MSTQIIVYLFALSAGIVSAGLVASLWELATDEKLDLATLSDLDLLSPLRGLSFALSRPSKLCGFAFAFALREPILALAALILAIGLSFLQGVFVMTQIFGIQ